MILGRTLMFRLPNLEDELLAEGWIAGLLKAQLDISTEQIFEILRAIREAGLILEVRQASSN